jgi:DNA-directed RNA polymerase specialized sigma24 family protein
MKGRDNNAGKPPRGDAPKSQGKPASEVSLESIVREVLLGKMGAWPALVSAINPHIIAITRSHPSMRGRKLANLEDDVAEVATSSLERLARDDFKNLRRFIAQRDEASGQASEGTATGSFESWLYGTVDFTIRDHLRKRFGRAPRSDDTGQRRPSRRDLGTLAQRLDQEPLDRAFVSTLGATKRITVAEIFEYATTHFDAIEAQALRLFYLEDKSAAEIAQELGLPDERAADKMIRKLNARLRYRFAADAEPGGA